MRRLVLVAVLVASCAPAPEQSAMEKWARAALNCPAGTITWSVLEPNCGTVDQAGNYAAPACPVPYVDLTCHLQASGCGNTAQLPVGISDSNVRGLVIYCGVIAPETCCRLPPLSVLPNTAVQFYAGFEYSCAGHVVYSPANPPALCP